MKLRVGNAGNVLDTPENLWRACVMAREVREEFKRSKDPNNQGGAGGLNEDGEEFKLMQEQGLV